MGSMPNKIHRDRYLCPACLLLNKVWECYLPYVGLHVPPARPSPADDELPAEAHVVAGVRVDLEHLH